MIRTPADSTDWLDGAAIGLSGLCLLHCLALPLAVGALPVMLPFVEGHLHAQLLVIVVPLSVAAIGVGFLRHRSLRVVAAAAVGLGLLVVGATVAHNHLGLAADRAFTITGAITLAAAHLFNGLLARRHHCDAATD